jgi:hypothetical protein
MIHPNRESEPDSRVKFAKHRRCRAEQLPAGGRRKPLIRLDSAKEIEGFNLDFVAPDLEFVAPGLDFVANNLDFLAGNLEILHRAYAAARIERMLSA